MVKRKLSIRSYLILMNLILLGLLFPSVTVLFINKAAENHESQLTQTLSTLRLSLENRGISLSRSIALSAEQALAGFDFTFLSNIILQVVTKDDDIEYCSVMDMDGNIMIHSDQDALGSVVESPFDLKALEIIKNSPATSEINGIQPVSLIKADDEYHLGVVTPLYLGSERWGGVLCGISLESLNDSIKEAEINWDVQSRQLRIYFFSIGIMVFIAGFFVASLLTRLFANAVEKLSSGAVRVANGDLTYHIEDEHLVCSEFSMFAKSFNKMTSSLYQSREELAEYNRSLEKMVADRTRALEEAQAELLIHAKEAGMAEIAQGVMHNIGNAMTPLKTSAQVSYKTIHESHLRHRLEVALQPIKEIIEQSDYSDKQRLSQIVELIPESIDNEYALVDEQLLRINERVEHIEGILRLQSKYIKMTGIKDNIDINAVITDTLNMMEDSLLKYNIQIITHLGDIPEIFLEKDQILQVMLNLIKNAREAMELTPDQNRILEITTEVIHEDRKEKVKVSIRDTGCGFGVESKDKLFNFGYTSKSEGTGIGLHTSANYIISQKGRLVAESEGDGKGATFSVILPLP